MMIIMMMLIFKLMFIQSSKFSDIDELLRKVGALDVMEMKLTVYYITA